MIKQRVFCADDNSMVHDAVRLQIEVTSDFQFVGCAGDADEMLRATSKPPPEGVGCPDVVLLDIDMPGKDPFAAIGDLAEHCGGVRVLMYSGLVSRELIDKALVSGAWGYVAKSDGQEGLVNALRAVVKGEIGLSPSVQATYTP